MTVLAISQAKSNADLIADCFELGYLNDTDTVLDPTYGLGRFWKKRRPARLVAHDIDPAKAPDGPMDFTRPHYEPETFDAVVFDPPYKLNGTGGSHASDAGYGVANNDTADQRMRLCLQGIAKLRRLVKPDGHLLVKCQDQVSSGRVWWQTYTFIEQATSGPERFRLVDALHLVSYRPQPEGRRQVHARRNYSTLLIFRKGKP